MIYFLYAIFFVSCLALIVSVLLQPGKTDAGALFTSNISSSAFDSRGTATVLSKMTIIAATLFMLSALFIAMPGLQGNVSVLNANPDDASATETTQPPISDLNANTATNSASATTNVAGDANTAAIQPADANANASGANANK